MTKKKMWITTGWYVLLTLIWTVNFFIHWHKDGMISVSTGLFGLAAALFAVAAVLGVIRVIRASVEHTEEKEKR